MKIVSTFAAAFLGLCLISCSQESGNRRPDWLIDPSSFVAKLEKRGADRIALENGLISRTFLLQPNAVTIGFDNLETGKSMLRGVKPEAEIELNGTKYSIDVQMDQPG